MKRQPKMSKAERDEHDLSIAFNSHLCQEILGKPFREVHESMEYGRQRKGTKRR